MWIKVCSFVYRRDYSYAYTPTTHPGGRRGLGDALAALESGSGRDPLQTPSAGYLMKGVSEATQTAGRHTGTLGKRREFEEGSSTSGAKRRRGESQGFGVDEVIDLTE